MQLIKEAFEKLYPNKAFNYSVKLKYTARFKPYNANVKYTKNNLEFSLSKQWRHISKDIVIGLMQTLLLKVFNDKFKVLDIEDAVSWLISTYDGELQAKDLNLIKHRIESKLIERTKERISKVTLYLTIITTLNFTVPIILLLCMLLGLLHNVLYLVIIFILILLELLFPTLFMR